MKKADIVTIILPIAGLFILITQRNHIQEYKFTDLQFSKAAQPTTAQQVPDGVYLNASEQIQARRFCRYRWGSHKDALDLIKVAPNPPKRQRILCYVHTLSSFHEKSQAIRDTWGARGCDKLLFISNTSSADTVDIPLVAYDHANLWDKSRKSFQYLM